MPRPLVAVALALTVILSGPLLSATPFQVNPTEAAKGSRPSDCPGRIGKLPFRSGQETRDERNGGEIVSLTCQYRKEQTRSGDPSVSISVQYYTPSYDTKGVAGYCWQVRRSDDPETTNERGGVAQPVGDHYIKMQYSTLNDRPPKAGRVRATAEQLVQDLVDEGLVAKCPGATDESGPDGISPEGDLGKGVPPDEDPDALAVPDEELSAAAQAYLDVLEQYRARIDELCVLARAADAADAPGDTIPMLARAQASYVEDLATDLAGLSLSFPSALEAELDALIFASIEETRLWRELSGDEPSTVSAEERAAAAIAASEASDAAHDELRRALGIPPSGGGSGADEGPCGGDEGAPVEDADGG